MIKKVFIISDEVQHWNFVPDGDHKNIYQELWGFESLKKILDVVKKSTQKKDPAFDWVVNGLQTGSVVESDVNPCNKSFNHAFATWKPYKEGPKNVWRISEMNQIGEREQQPVLGDCRDELKSSDLVILQDWGLDIRGLNDPGTIKELENKWAIYRSYPPDFEGPLWEKLNQVIGAKSILLLRVNALRQFNISISKGLSWEQSLEDLLNEIYFRRNISLHLLRTAEYVVLDFGCTATLLLYNDPQDPPALPKIQFFFDPEGVEHYWEDSHPGYLPGNMDLLAALISKEVLSSSEGNEINMARAVRAHLLCWREIMLAGADQKSPTINLEVLSSNLEKIYSGESYMEFQPVKLNYEMFQDLFKPGSRDRRKDWSLLSLTQWDYYSLARKIALEGPETALKGWNIPIARYKHLITVDRKEMEFLHYLKTLITEYLSQRNNQPLSIAVFGSPGSGKSFAIKQLARALDMPDQDIEEVTFNLSQFNEDDPAALYQAFHVVRDISLSGSIPLVFWDEFDSKNLTWLRYFLAPMQDGEFQEGQLTHSIGKSIFVFAGGTCHCMEQFEETAQDKKADKGPDFLSRLKAYVNVLGPNPILPYALEKENETETEENLPVVDEINIERNIDPEYIIRRALLINSLLSMGYKQLFKNKVLQIDDGVLNALLKIPKFKHGTRSMETIFKTSQLTGKRKFNRSDLPPISQIDLHVDGEEFFELMAEDTKFYPGGNAFYHLVNEVVFSEKIVERLAVGVHAMYDLIFSINQDRDPFTITQEEFLKHYDQMKKLPESLLQDEVSQNHHNASSIPEKLAAAGLAVVPLSANHPEAEFSREELEKVSRMEHIRWTRHHIDAGWKFNVDRKKPLKLHNALVAWDDEERENAPSVYGKSYASRMGTEEGQVLSEHYRDLDRLISMAIPWLLESAGYKMVRL